MSQQLSTTTAVIGIDIGKNSFHVVGLDGRGAIALRQRWSPGQVETRLANIPHCLIGMEACVGAHHLSRRLKGLGHDARLMPAKYVRTFGKRLPKLPPIRTADMVQKGVRSIWQRWPSPLALFCCGNSATRDVGDHWLPRERAPACFVKSPPLQKPRRRFSA